MTEGDIMFSVKTTGMKKIAALLLAAALIGTFSGIPASAEQTEKTNYPFIFVHGMMGWGTGSKKEITKPYWGCSQANNMMVYLNNKGYKCYNPAVSGLGSAWDRACELYAQLEGTVVDYGAAHSATHNHARYGRSYIGKPVMGKPWDFSEKINLVGHSFGGATVRLFASLMAYGDAGEKAASGDNLSPLFAGGHTDSIYSISTLAAPHNGSVISDTYIDSKAIMTDIAFLANLNGTAGSDLDLSLDQFGLSCDPATGKKASISLAGIRAFANGTDNCGYDLSLNGAAELNQKIKTVSNIYYFSYSACVTKESVFGTQIPESSIYPLLLKSSVVIGMSDGWDVHGIKLTKEWQKNDGIVPLNSALYPFGAKTQKFSDANGVYQTGIWYQMPTLSHVDHFDFCTSSDFNSYKGGYTQFYTDLAELICGL